MSVTVSTTSNSITVTDQAALSGASVTGTASNGLNYNLNASVNTISSGSGSNANTISGGGNSANPNRILNDAADSTCSYRTISGGYDNTIGSTNNGDGSIASTISGGAHHRIRRPTDASDNPNPAMAGTQPLSGVPRSSSFTIDQPDHGTIGGGGYNAIRNGNYGTIAGGSSNIIQGENATYATGYGAVIGGGETNEANGNNATVAGGTRNAARAAYSTIGGGYENRAFITSDYSKNSQTIAGGKFNTINESNGSTISGGESNSINVSGVNLVEHGVIGGGNLNTIGNSAAGSYSAIVGGYANTVNSWWSTVIGGSNNTITTSNYAVACGSYANVPAGMAMAFAHGGGQFATAGDAQSMVIMLRRQTTTSSATTLTIDASPTGYLYIPNDTTWLFDCLVVARRTDANDQSAAYRIVGCIDNNASTVALVGTPTVTVIGEDVAGWDASASADNTNKALAINVTGAASSTVNWVGRMTIVQVIG
jgi:hypothetical protein